MKFLQLLLIGIVCTSCIKPQHTPVSFTNKPYYFDAGGSDSKPKDSSILITPEFEYNADIGYGFQASNLSKFYHKSTERSRDEFLIDGVIGTELTFKADIPEGKWWLTIWFDPGMEDSITTQLYINGLKNELNLQSFSSSAEPRETIQKMYRVVQRKVDIQKDFSFSLKGVEDEVRLLGFSLIPSKEQPSNEIQKDVFNEIQEIGDFRNSKKVDDLVSTLEEIKSNPDNLNFASYWIQQLNILKEAEKYFYYRGWSWATEKTGMGLFDHIPQSIVLYDALLSFEDATDHPLYSKALWYRARLLYWLWLEGAGPKEELSGKRDLAEMYKIYPDDEIVQMYNGYKLDQIDQFDKIPKKSGTPEWASTQWELTNRLKDIVDWWVNEQQDENGELGGKFGDDVEILRWWSPLILSGDETSYLGWKRLADGVWNSSKVKNGYAKTPSDVEHSSEFISDTAPLMVLYTDNPDYLERLKYSSDYFQNLWTGYNNKGARFFKSAWFSSSEIEMDEPKNRDVSYNARATKAVRYYNWKTNDQDTRNALVEWADAWVDISKSAEKSKPIGIIPPSVEFPSGKINGDEPTWYLANMYWDYFDWSGSTAILDQLLYTWTFTGDEKYLQPLLQHLDLILTYSEDLESDKNPFKDGSEGWAAYILGNSSGFWNVVENWRLLNASSAYDDLILEHGSSFVKYRITGKEQYLVEAMKPYLETVRYNKPMLTSEVIHTDRVFIKEPRVREAGILQGMITGFGVDESASPYIAVSWENTDRDLTYLVTDSDSTKLNVNLYSFSDQEVETTMRIWQLKQGKYELARLIDGRTESEIIEIFQRGERVEIKVPSHELMKITIIPLNE
tara:strand:+ start:41780 stop:44317 length:2538 start_codon:yes stop_codon:yes gene_type:complete